jgi:methylmalonyl-CoA/ethylmalonyl-CoA epimerase
MPPSNASHVCKTSDGPARPLEGFDRVIQVGVVVRDIEGVMKRLTELFGIGPFRVVDCPPPERADRQFYYGELAKFHTRQAFADLGSIELELIEPLEGRTIWSDFLAERGPGIHHIRFNVPDQEKLTAYLSGQGIGKSQEGAGIRDGSYWVNYDTEKLVGFIVEILQPAPDSDGRTPGVVGQTSKKETP